MLWHLGKQEEFGGIVRTDYPTPLGQRYFELVADWVEDGLVLYWIEPKDLPKTVPIPAIELNKRLLKERGWHPLNPVPQPAFAFNDTIRDAGTGIGIAAGSAVVFKYVKDWIIVTGQHAFAHSCTIPILSAEMFDKEFLRCLLDPNSCPTPG
jgi:hypothetical protein